MSINTKNPICKNHLLHDPASTELWLLPQFAEGISVVNGLFRYGQFAVFILYRDRKAMECCKCSESFDRVAFLGISNIRYDSLCLAIYLSHKRDSRGLFEFIVLIDADPIDPQADILTLLIEWRTAHVHCPINQSQGSS